MKNIIILTNIQTTGLSFETDSLIELSMIAIDTDNNCETIYKPFHHKITWNINRIKREIDLVASRITGYTKEDIDTFENSIEVVKDLSQWIKELKRETGVDKFWFCSFNEFTYTFFRNFLYNTTGANIFNQIFYYRDLRLQDLSIVKIIQNFDILNNPNFKFSRDIIFSILCPNVDTKKIVGKDYNILKAIFSK